MIILHIVIRKNDFNLLTSSGFDLRSRSLKIQLLGPWIMSKFPRNFIRFDQSF